MIGLTADCDIDYSQFEQSKIDLKNTLSGCSFVSRYFFLYLYIKNIVIIALIKWTTFYITTTISLNASTQELVLKNSKVDTHVSEGTDAAFDVTESTLTESVIQTKTTHNPDFFEIQECKFDALPISVRGRCKIVDVQALLNKILQYYITSSNPINRKNDKSNTSKKSKSQLKIQTQNISTTLMSLTPLSLSELTNAGYKVTGKTGDNILSALRSLGYIRVNKNSVNGHIGILLSESAIDQVIKQMKNWKEKYIYLSYWRYYYY